MGGFTTLLASALLTATAATPIETQVEAAGPEGPLRGTMLAPANDTRAVVLILPGSGAIDRDGNSPRGGVYAATYRLLAEGLADRGIATVRIDKRGLFGSAGAGDPNGINMSDYAEDTRQWVTSIRARTGAECVWLLGHSEGGLVALLASQQPEHICGLVLASAGGRPLGAVLREQLRANPANAPLLDRAMAAIDSLEAGRRHDVEGMNPALMPLFAPQLQDYWISVMSYDPAELIAAIERPVLIVHGQRDIQVTEVDARRLAEANSGARLVLVADANHVLKAAPVDRAANAATYGDPSLPLAPEIVDAIAAFVAPAQDGGSR